MKFRGSVVSQQAREILCQICNQHERLISDVLRETNDRDAVQIRREVCRALKRQGHSIPEIATLLERSPYAVRAILARLEGLK